MQREIPGISMEEMEALVGQRPRYLSGGPIENFREGWAHFIMGNSHTAHFYKRRNTGEAIAQCGHIVPVRWIYGAGNYPQCKRCTQILKRLGSKG